MKILVTGATGFIGGFVLRELIQRGHQALVISRTAAPASWRAQAGIEVFSCDLGDPKSLELGGKDVDAIVHLAAALQGSRAQQIASTIRGTENLLKAASTANIRHVVGISSLAVMDFVSVGPGALIDESIRCYEQDSEMGLYAALKRDQEQLFLRFARSTGNGCFVLRPGLVYDGVRLSAAHAGVVQRPLCILASHDGEVPTVDVAGLSRAIVNAAEIRVSGSETVLLVDDALPRQGEYLGELRRRGSIPAHAPTLPWQTVNRMAGSLGRLAAACGLGAHRPEMLRTHSLSARIKPFRYSNAKAKTLLKWEPGSIFPHPSR